MRAVAWASVDQDALADLALESVGLVVEQAVVAPVAAVGRSAPFVYERSAYRVEHLSSYHSASQSSYSR